MGVSGIDEKKKPAMSMAKSEKPAIAKKAPMKDMSKPGKGFEKVTKK